LYRNGLSTFHIISNDPSLAYKRKFCTIFLLYINYKIN